MKTRFAVEQRLAAPADVVYHCLVVPIYRDEPWRLERYARAHASAPS